MYVEYSVIISTLVSHKRVEIDLGKRALQLLEDHTRFMKRFYGNRTNPSSQARPNFYVGLRLTRERCSYSRLRYGYGSSGYDYGYGYPSGSYYGNVIEAHEHKKRFQRAVADSLCHPCNI
jgi:hypothetical protein